MIDTSQEIDLTNDEHVRTFWADGHYWRVHEIKAPRFDRRGGTHLIFEAQEIVRRVRHFPENWIELSDEDLYALCDRRRQPRD